jgi:hypothetical protein
VKRILTHKAAGGVFEWFAARLAHRDRSDLYHSALEVRIPEGRFVIEQAPAWSEHGERGVVGVVNSWRCGGRTLTSPQA